MYHPIRQLKQITFLLSAFVAIVSSNIQGQSLSVQGPVDSLTTGSVFDFSITLQSQQGYDRIIFPDSSFFNSNVEWLSRQQFKLSDFSDSTHYQLQFFGVSNEVIPPLPVQVIADGDTSTLFTQAFPIKFKSVLASEEDPLKPIKPNFTFPRPWWPWALALLIAAIAGYFIYQRYFKPEEVAEKPVKKSPEFVNPLNTLETQLRDLRKVHEAAGEKDYKWFYSELGDALRLYIEDLYKIPALESTSREVLRYMDAFGVDAEMIKHMRSILREADMVKFAKFTPTLDASMNAYHTAHSFLDRAKIVDVRRIDRLREEFNARFRSESNEEDTDGMG